MNEPSVFGSYEMSVPRDVRHFGGWENREIHNIYGQCYHNATYLGHLIRSDFNLRPFILTRSFFTGSQRTAAIWTGDNMAAWDHLRYFWQLLLVYILCLGPPFQWFCLCLSPDFRMLEQTLEVSLEIQMRSSWLGGTKLVRTLSLN